MRRVNQTVWLRLDLQTDSDVVSGCVEHADGTRRPFWSWLELVSEVEDAVHGRTAETGVDADGPPRVDPKT